MADLQAALMTQLRNIEARTGQSLAALQAAVIGSGNVKFSDRRSWLMAQFALGYGDANAVVGLIGKLPAEFAEAGVAVATAGTAAAAVPDDPLDALYAGAKAHLRPIHEAVMAAVREFGPCEQAPKKTYMSLRRSKQFAMLGPATKDRVEIGLNARDLPPHARLKVLPPGGMCQATTRIGSVAEVDAELKTWLRQAYDAAG
jgi:hypothetical protein